MMNFLQKYKTLIILVLLEFAFYLKLNIINNQAYFLNWSIIGTSFLLYNLFNVIKTNPIISLFTINSNKKNKIEKQSTIKERLLSESTIFYLLFISTNFLLYIIS
jgi:hypothetical protein